MEFYSVLSGSTKIASRVIMQLISTLFILFRTIQMFSWCQQKKASIVDDFSNWNYISGLLNWHETLKTHINASKLPEICFATRSVDQFQKYALIGSKYWNVEFRLLGYNPRRFVHKYDFGGACCLLLQGSLLSLDYTSDGSHRLHQNISTCTSVHTHICDVLYLYACFDTETVLAKGHF